MSGADLLQEANFDPWESVQSALERVPAAHSERAAWLWAHLLDTKRLYWQLLLDAEPPALPLPDFLRWEVTVARSLTAGQLARRLSYSGRELSAAELLRLNARHSLWHAGQLMALRP